MPGVTETPEETATRLLCRWAVRRATGNSLHRKLRLAPDVWDLMHQDLVQTLRSTADSRQAADGS